MGNPVSERPQLGLNPVALVRALFYELGAHAVRSNRSVPKDGSELVTMQALSQVTVPEFTGDIDDLSIGSQISLIRVSTDVAHNLTGIADGAGNDPAEGRTLTIINIGSNNLVLKHQDSNSLAANRFAIRSDITLAPDDGCALWYDATDLRWRRRSTF